MVLIAKVSEEISGYMANQVTNTTEYFNCNLKCIFIEKNANVVYPVNSMWITWNDNCEAKSEAKNPRPLRGLQVDFSLTRNVSYVVR